MRKLGWLLLLLLIALLVSPILIYRWHERAQPRSGPASSADHPARLPPDSLTQNRRLQPAPPVQPAANQLRAGEADPELIGVKDVLRDFRAAFGENPTGTNAEITKALTGQNTRHANFAGTNLSLKDGQMIDRWGHPYFFHQLSGTDMEIRSAGPDGVMWTPDDELIR